MIQCDRCHLHYTGEKIKELLLNFLRSEDEYVEVSCLIKLFSTLGNWLASFRKVLIYLFLFYVTLFYVLYR